MNSDANFCGIFSTADTVVVSIKDAYGAEFANGSFSLGGCSHTTFILAARFPATKNRAGTVTFTLTNGTTITGLGLRASPTGALTSVDMLEPMTY